MCIRDSYYVMEKLALMPIYMELTSQQAQEISIRIRAGRMIVLLNGELAFNNDDLPRRKHPRRYVFEHDGIPNEETVSLSLRAGKNTLAVVSGHVDRGTGIQFSMELLACQSPVSASVPLNMPEDVRTEIFMSQQQTHMIDDCYTLGETPVVHIGRMPLTHCCASVSVRNAQEEIRCV